MRQLIQKMITKELYGKSDEVRLQNICSFFLKKFKEHPWL